MLNLAIVLILSCLPSHSPFPACHLTYPFLHPLTATAALDDISLLKMPDDDVKILAAAAPARSVIVDERPGGELRRETDVRSDSGDSPSSVCIYFPHQNTTLLAIRLLTTILSNLPPSVTFLAYSNIQN